MQTARRTFRPLGIADILDETADLYRGNFALLIGIAAICYVPYSLLNAILTPNVMSIDAQTDPTAVFGAIVPSMLLLLFFLAVIVPIVTGALTFAISERYLGRPTSIGACYKRILRADVFLPFLVALLLKYGALFAIYVGCIVIIVMGGAIGGLGGVGAAMLIAIPLGIGMVVLLVYGALRLILVEPAFIVEMRGAVGSIGRSWSLMPGSMNKAFWVALIVIVVAMVLSVMLTVPTQAIIAIKSSRGLSVSPIVYVLHTLLGTIANVLIAPIYSVVVILLYYDVRIRKEGFDLEMLARELDEKSTTEASQGITSLPQEQIPTSTSTEEAGPSDGTGNQ